MIPISLKIKGLYSYQSEQVIDFKHLTDAQLFGIFGAVGSGKSTILEAISFALYSDTERLSKGDARNYNMMNLKSSELLIDFVFENHDHVLYRFVVSGKRNGKKFNEVSAFKRSAYQYDGTWIPLEVTTAERIIGLSYENFRRTIIIPQGKFQEFLQLGDAERTRMLKEIFHLEKFEFYRQADALDKKNDALMQELSGRMNQLGDVTEELLQEKETELQTLTEIQQAAQQDLEKVLDSEKSMSALKKQFDEKKLKLAHLAKLETQKEHFNDLNLQVERFEYCQIHFKSLIDNETKAHKSHKDKQQELKSSLENLAKVESALQELKLKFENVSAEFKNLESRQKEKQDLEFWIEIKKTQVQLEEKKSALKQHVEKLEQLNTNKATFEKSVQELKDQIDALKNEQNKFSDWAGLNGWYIRANHLNEQYKKTQTEIENLQQLFAEKNSLLQHSIPETLNAQLSQVSFDQQDSILSELEQLEKQNQSKVQELQNQLEKLKIQAQLADFTAQIHDGEACPLCGSHEHPNVLHIEAVSADIENLTLEQKRLANEQVAISNTSKKLSIAFNDLSSMQQILNAFKSQLEILENDKKEHRKTFIWNEFSPDNKEAFDVAQQAFKKRQEELNVLENKHKESQSALQKAQQDFENEKLLVSNIETDIKILENQIFTTKNRLTQTDETLAILDHNTLSEKLAALALHISKVTENHEKLSEQIQRGELALVSAQTEKTGLEKSVSEYEKELKAIQTEFDRALSNSPFSSREEVESILKLNLDTANLKTKITEFNQNLFSLTQELKALEQVLAGQKFDEEEYKLLLENVALKKATVEESNKNQISAEGNLKRLRTDWEAKKSFQKEYDQLELRKTNIKTLKSLFKASGFVNYISSVYLQNLCEAANERFHKLTRQQLRLELNENNNFQVRDYLNEGRVRSVKTLSGGQTFQASLCLALALAESIPQQSKAKQNFFFLDEGFGSLDKESLLSVFESLKALRQENRIVGVISHVEELQQEISTYLTVVNDPELGSIVTE